MSMVTRSGPHRYPNGRVARETHPAGRWCGDEGHTEAPAAGAANLRARSAFGSIDKGERGSRRPSTAGRLPPDSGSSQGDNHARGRRLPCLSVRFLTSRPAWHAARLLVAAACAATLALAAACGGSPAPPPTSGPPAPAVADPGAGGGHGGAGGHNAGPGGIELYAVQTGTVGTVVTDGVGRLLYGSAGDANDPPASRCADACAQRWHPLVVPPGQEPVLLGVDADKVGRVVRPDGASQVTLSGWPLYVNDDDQGSKRAAPDARGAWFLMTPQGEKVPV